MSSFFEHCELISRQKKQSKVIRFFPETDLRNGHDGLTKVASKHGIKLKELDAGEFVVFASTSLKGIKIYAPGNVIAYVKHPLGQKLDMRIVALVPRFFNGGNFNELGAMREILKRAA